MSEPTLYRRWPDPQGGRWVYLPVERCEHGRLDPHYMPGKKPWTISDVICPGSPTLREADDE